MDIYFQKFLINKYYNNKYRVNAIIKCIKSKKTENISII